MLIDYKNKLVYVATTKTASTAIEDALGPRRKIGFLGGSDKLKHTSLDQLLKIRWALGIGDFVTWTTIRHPREKFLSWFRYRSRPAAKASHRYLGQRSLSQHIEMCNAIDLQECDDRRIMCGAKGELPGIVFKHEDFPEVVAFLNQVYGIKGLPRSNESMRKITPTNSEIAAIDALLAEPIAWYESIVGNTADEAIGALSSP